MTTATITMPVIATPVIAIHGGAGTITRAALSAADEVLYHTALNDILLATQALLNRGGSALDAVSMAVRLLEDCPLFNAGKGAVYTRAGTHELDAAIMDGATAQKSDHRDQPVRVHEPIDPDHKFGTVGAVALDGNGNLAAATSTGGITNKQVGRVGDTPLIGAGCYAANATAAVSATGTGEVFMRTVAAYDVAARMAYGGATLPQAVEQVVMHVLPQYGGRGGLIALDQQGNLALTFNTEGMYRGYARGDAPPVTAIYRE
jgi:isoaspartyl peptidase/L-asparaginase-like protein (Ntn-hydrolase superfamily)